MKYYNRRAKQSARTFLWKKNNKLTCWTLLLQQQILYLLVTPSLMSRIPDIFSSRLPITSLYKKNPNTASRVDFLPSRQWRVDALKRIVARVPHTAVALSRTIQGVLELILLYLGEQGGSVILFSIRAGRLEKISRQRDNVYIYVYIQYTSMLQTNFST